MGWDDEGLKRVAKEVRLDERRCRALEERGELIGGHLWGVGRIDDRTGLAQVVCTKRVSLVTLLSLPVVRCPLLPLSLVRPL